MINNNTYRISGTQFGAKLDSSAYAKLRKSSSREISDCIDSCAKRFENWGYNDSVISIAENKNTGKSVFTISNNRLGDKVVKLGFEKRDSELIHAFLSITEDMIKSAENFIKKSHS